jgi:MFS family permease
LPGVASNLRQFVLLIAVNLTVGAMVGQERTVVPLLATETFGMQLGVATTTFLISFGIAKALGNLVAGGLADRRGRRPVLLSGWLLMSPVPVILALSGSWGWVVFANALLGTGQGLAWSMTVTMKMDLAGADRRGLAAGANEAAGYLGLALAAFVTGAIAERAGLRPWPFVFGAAVGVVGLAISLLTRETHHHALREPSLDATRDGGLRGDRTFAAAAQAGLFTNLNDAVAWVTFPIVFTAGGLSLAMVGLLVAIYPAVWGLGQLATGPMSDRWGRRPSVVLGMLIQSVGLVTVGAGGGAGQWAVGAVLMGIGTAMVYPVLLASVGDVSAPRERASRLGVYRFWRDMGFAVGGLVAGVLAGTSGAETALMVTAVVTAGSGVVAFVWLRETRRAR